ncbi:hypothetical protein D910_01470 [Dendroctonus ponderosae]|uniref:Origin recognition complex subunit 3 n=1 Tax=Dendroctonus ponderosae TaxID=77166 RepID=U4TRM0_DENPD|nr:hypothetical protein D910_01470 [Dendroctonus ponderosae]
MLSGIFVFKPKKKPQHTTLDELFSENRWYQTYISLWTRLNQDFEDLTESMFTSMTSDLLNFVKTSHQNDVTEIPTAALLTGINMPDHDAQFASLKRQVKEDVSPYVAFLSSQDCGNVKSLMEIMISQFIGLSDDREEYEDDLVKNTLKKSSLNMSLLESWYQQAENELLVVIIPDFESFNAKVLQSFILIISSHLGKLPFVFIFGIATCISTLHTSFPYHVTMKINVHVFKCEPSIVYLNQVLEGIFLDIFCPFHLGGKVLDLFTEIFLFYDFSVQNFVQNIKFAMMEHFSHGNAMALCLMEKTAIKNVLVDFNHEDCENVRHLLSFRNLVESEPYEQRIKLITDDEYFKQAVCDKVVAIQRYIKRLHVFLRCLHALVYDLPGSPLGKNLRELYTLALTKSITQSAEYRESFQLLEFQSKDALQEKLRRIADILAQFVNKGSSKTKLRDFCVEIDRLVRILQNTDVEESEKDEISLEEGLGAMMDRKALKQALFSRSKQKSKTQDKYEKLKQEILAYLSGQFEEYLVHPSTLPFYEIFFFDDISIKNHIIGIHRAAIHNALNDPHRYLQCKCCAISNKRTVKALMPDICIAYKLHLEWGKMINLYDWLMGFLCIVDPQEEDDLSDKSKKVVDPHVQARFTQAVAELEYLGFIKSSKRKTDHVIRLTWEG